MNVNLSANTLFRRYYAAERNLRFDSARLHTDNHSLVSADSKAIKKAVEQVKKLDYEDTSKENLESVFNTVKSYVDTHNNTIESATDSVTKDIQKTARNMINLTKEFRREFEEIGIKVKNDGTLEIDEGELKKATTVKVKKIFAKDSEFIREMEDFGRRLKKEVGRETLASAFPPEKRYKDSTLELLAVMDETSTKEENAIDFTV